MYLTTMSSIYLSRKKIIQLKQELKRYEASLKKQKDELNQRGGLTGSWHETASFSATLAALEAKVNELKSLLKETHILSEKIKGNKAILGSYVTLINDKKGELNYRLVHPLEANPESDLLSVESPLGRLIIDKEAGDTIELNGKKMIIVSIK
jgi:transcription elongation factor GreA